MNYLAKNLDWLQEKLEPLEKGAWEGWGTRSERRIGERWVADVKLQAGRPKRQTSRDRRNPKSHWLSELLLTTKRCVSTVQLLFSTARRGLLLHI